MRGAKNVGQGAVPPLAPIQVPGRPGQGARPAPRHLEHKSPPAREAPSVLRRPSHSEPSAERRQGASDFWGDDGPPPPNSRLTAVTDATLRTNIGELIAPQQGRNAVVVQKARRIATGMLNSLAPSGFREGSKAALAQEDLGRLLSALLQDWNRSSFMNRLPRISHPDFPAIVEETLKNHLKVEELESLYRMLTGDDPQVQTIRTVADRLLGRVNPALSPSLQELLRRAIRPGQAPEVRWLAFQDVRSKASQLLPEGSNADSHRAVMEATAYLLHKKVLPENDVREFLVFLPINELMAIRSAIPDDPGVLGGALFVRIAQECVETRCNEAQKAIEEKVDQLLKWRQNEKGCIESPGQFARAVIDLTNLFGSYQLYTRATRKAQPAPVDLKKLADALKPLSNPDNLPSDELLLKDLDNAIGKLPVRGDGGEVEKACEARRKANLAAHAALSNDVVAVLQRVGHGPSLTQALGAIKEAMNAHASSRAPSKLEFREEVKRRVDALPLESRLALAKAMRSDEMLELCAVLREMGRCAVVKDHEALCTQLYELEALLDAVRTAAHPTRVEELHAIEDLASVGPGVREALNALGIQIGTGQNVNVTSGIASRTLQTQLERDAQAAGGSPATDPSIQRDLKLATLSVAGKPLADMAELTASLNALCADNPMLLETLHNENLARALIEAATHTMAGLMATLGSDYSPIRDQAGSSLELLGSRSIDFDFRRDDRLGLVMSCRLTIDKSKHGLTGGPGARTRIHLQGEADFTYDVAISPERVGRVAKPLEMRYAVLPPIFWAGNPFQKPENVEEITKPYADQRLVDRFKAFLESEHSIENWLFVQAVDGLENMGKDEGVQRARTILANYVAQDEKAFFQVNLPANIRNEILSPLDADDPAPFATLRARLAVGRREIVKVMQTDTYRRFVNSVEANPGAAADTTSLEAPASAARSAPRDARREAFLSVQFKILAGQSEDAASLGRAVSLLPLHEDKVDQEYLKKFRQDIDGSLARLDAAQRASLLYNIDNELTAEQRNDDHVRIVREAVIAARMNTREGRMTPEGALLEGADFIENGRLYSWLVQGRVSDAEMASYLANEPNLEARARVFAAWQDDPEYDAAAVRRLASIVKRTLDARQERTDHAQKAVQEHYELGELFILSARNWVPDTSSSSSSSRGPAPRLTRGAIQQLGLLARQFDNYRKLSEQVNPKAMDSQRLRGALSQIDEKLKPYLSDLDGTAFDEPYLSELAASLRSLGRPSAAVDDALRLLELRQREEQAELPPPPPDDPAA